MLDLFWGEPWNIQAFSSFPNTEVAQVVEIHPQWKARTHLSWLVSNMIADWPTIDNQSIDLGGGGGGGPRIFRLSAPEELTVSFI